MEPKRKQKYNPSVRELRKVCKTLGIKGYSNKPKVWLLRHCKEYALNETPIGADHVDHSIKYTPLGHKIGVVPMPDYVNVPDIDTGEMHKYNTEEATKCLEKIWAAAKKSRVDLYEMFKSMEPSERRIGVQGNYRSAYLMIVAGLFANRSMNCNLSDRGILLSIVRKGSRFIFNRAATLILQGEYDETDFDWAVHSCSHELLIFPLVLQLHGLGSHANTLVINTKYKKVYVFEPHGVAEWSDEVGLAVQNYVMPTLFNLDDSYKFIETHAICPHIGPQSAEEDRSIACSAWSMWFGSQMLLNPGLRPKTVIAMMMRHKGTNIQKTAKELSHQIHQFIAFSTSILTLAEQDLKPDTDLTEEDLHVLRHALAHVGE